ncbi:MAG: PP2C family protein-serine/threonine phosphatase [Terriglobales bacterium]
MQCSDLAALYRAARVGGDFFDFVPVGPNRLIFALLDIAGKRDQALHVAACVQEALRARAPELFSKDDMNEADALTDLVLAVNQAILKAAGGVRCAPGIVACYNEMLGIVYYINAGSVPALVKAEGAITVLEAGGLPLGLFSHATHDAQVCVLPEGGSLLLTSRGLLEVKAGGEEYGLERLKESLRVANGGSAHDLCSHVLRTVSEFIEQNKRRRFLKFGGNSTNGETDALGENDVTAVALLRSSARAGVASAR